MVSNGGEDRVRLQNYPALVSILLAISIPAVAALLETSDFPILCEGAAAVTVPAELQGKFMDPKTTGWLEVGPAGIVRVDWKGFNFHSKAFAEKGYCVRHGLKERQDGAASVSLTIERVNDGLVANSDAYSVAVGFRKDTSAYFLTATSSGSITLGFIPLGGSTALPTETVATRKAPEESPRNLSSR